MNTAIIQQEILLLTGTSLAQRELCEKDAKDESRYWSESEKLANACWTGLLDELLPEIIIKKLHIWQIWNTEYSLQIEFSQYPSSEKRFSINPYYFLEATGYN